MAAPALRHGNRRPENESQWVEGKSCDYARDFNSGVFPVGRWSLLSWYGRRRAIAPWAGVSGGTGTSIPSHPRFRVRTRHRNQLLSSTTSTGELTRKDETTNIKNMEIIRQERKARHYDSHAPFLAPSPTSPRALGMSDPVLDRQDRGTGRWKNLEFACFPRRRLGAPGRCVACRELPSPQRREE
ncbi:hypothetical protein LZ30DRAFT_114105 [Colletotrichum cereale]|nr:hypothetical protein LZ30DRAFT_114105 [Colletotrichum cereale]